MLVPQYQYVWNPLNVVGIEFRNNAAFKTSFQFSDERGLKTALRLLGCFHGRVTSFRENIKVSAGGWVGDYKGGTI